MVEEVNRKLETRPEILDRTTEISAARGREDLNAGSSG